MTSSWSSEDLKAKVVDVSESFDHSGILMHDSEDKTEVSLCLLVPEQSMAWLIGKAGANINEIKGITGANLSFGKKDSSIQGLRRGVAHGSVSSVSRAVLVMTSLIQQHQSQCAMGIVVASVAAGAVIGKGGGTLKLLREQTGCRLEMQKREQTHPGFGGRCLAVSHSDSPLAVTQAIYKIMRIKGFVSLSTKDILNPAQPEYLPLPLDVFNGGFNRDAFRGPLMCTTHNKPRGKQNLRPSSTVPGAWECNPGDACKGSGGVPLVETGAARMCATHNKKRGQRNLTSHPSLPGAFVCLPADPCK